MFMYRICKAMLHFKVWLGRFTPAQVGVRSIGDAPGNSRIQSPAHSVEPFRCSFPGKEFLINRIDIAGNEVRAISIGACHNQRWHTHHVGSQTCSDQVLDSRLSWYEYFPAHMPTLFLG